MGLLHFRKVQFGMVSVRDITYPIPGVPEGAKVAVDVARKEYYYPVRSIRRPLYVEDHAALRKAHEGMQA